MSEQEGVALMETSKNSEEWNANCSAVRRACGGQYPEWWFRAIVQSGLSARVTARWGSDDQLHVTKIG